ncbi:hypothetical protein AB0G00_19095 [Nocardia salmonicida]|uniref:DUF7691 family protein n=1 Tax=Nocardia salmonicida TaxID=53431 RepID=UPI0033F7DC33
MGSHCIELRSARLDKVLSFIGATSLSADQVRVLSLMKDRATAYQDTLDHQDIFWDLSIPDALDHLVRGRADTPGENAGCAYHAALQIIIAINGSDPAEVGYFRNPISYFFELDEELQRCGVPQELCSFGFLFAGPPAEIPFHIPGSLEGYPEVGHLALSRAKTVADAYRAVIDKIDQDFVDDLTTLVEKLEFEHETWLSRQGRDPSWSVADTLSFSTD